MTGSVDTIINQFQSETDEIREAPEPIFLRSVIWVLTLFIVLAVIMSAFLRIDRVVTSERGRIVPAEGTMLFQALDTSIIKTLDVREGDEVKKGQLLATLDPTFADADVEQLEKQLRSLDAQIARAEAEQSGIEYQPSSSNLASDQYSALQKALFDQRRQQLKSQVASFDEKIAQTRATIQRLNGDDIRYKEREKISQQIEGMRQQLVEKQAGSLLNLMIASDSRLEMLRTMENGRNSLIEAEHQLLSLKADRDAFVQQWLSTSSQDLVTARGNRDNVISLLAKASKHKDLIKLIAPEDGFVLTRARASVGSVLKAGDTLMTLVPGGARVEAEVNITSREIGFIRPGDNATVKIDAFNFVEHGYAEGKLIWISEGAFTLDDDGKPTPPYYKGRIAIEKMKFIRVPGTFRLIPGMTLTSDIHIGQRSVLAYLLGGAMGGLHEAMREP